MDQNPNPSPGQNMFLIYFYLSSGHSLYYVLNGSASLNNTGSTTYYNLDGPSQTWNSFSRNITADYIAGDWTPSNPATVTAVQIRIILDVTAISAVYTRAYIDNINIADETVHYMSSSYKDGDFETQGWARSTNTDSNYLSETTDAYEGTYAANLTLSTSGNASYASIGQYVR